MNRSSHIHTWRVVGLDCPDCAKKLEQAISLQAGIVAAEIDFIAGVLQVICSLESGCEKYLQELGKEHGVTFQDISSKPSETGMVFWSRESAISIASGLTIALGWFFAIRSLFIFSMIFAGVSIAKKAWANLKSRILEMNFLMLLAATGAVIIGEYLEGATVLFLFSISKWLERASTEKARVAIDALKVQLPTVAHLVSKNGEEIDMLVSKVNLGEIIRIKPNERIPLDGSVSEGGSNVDESALTGESVAVSKEPGSSVFAGTWNQEGTLLVEVSALANESRLSRVMISVEKAQRQKTKFQSSIERFAEIYTPSVVLIAILVAILPPVLLGQAWVPWFHTALVLLVIACPCALVLAAPVTLVSTMASAAGSGILIRGGDIIESAATVRVACFDKTGTLTLGSPEILEVLPTSRTSQTRLLLLAASLEAASDHPLARAFKNKAGSQNISTLSVSEFFSSKGHGIGGTIDGVNYRFGNLEWALAIAPEQKESLPAFTGTCVTVSALCDNLGPLGVILLGDKIRPEAKNAISQLKNLDVLATVLLSGDRVEVANEFGAALGINQSYGKLLPEDKAVHLERLSREIGPTIMIGDGINDTPALATATVGVAMGSRGTDAALETAGVVFLNDDLSRLPMFLTIAKKARLLIHQNIYLAVGIKLSVFVLSLLGLAKLWMAVFADTGTSLLVVINGLRALKIR